MSRTDPFVHDICNERLYVLQQGTAQSEKIQISLQRMRDVVFNHQQANMMEPPREAHYRPINGYDHEGPNPFHEDAKGNGGFAGPDQKKRRGVSLLLAFDGTPC